MKHSTIPPLKLLFMLLAAVAASAQSASAETVRKAFLEIGGDRIYYEVSGAGAPLVLVGGGSGMGIEQWQRVAPALAADYRVVAFDPRGIGHSDNPSVRYSDTDDLKRLLDALELERVTLIGLSSSGGFVLDFASRHPGRVAGVVAAAPFVPGFEFTDAMLQRLETFSQAAARGREDFLDAMFADPYFIPAVLDESVRPLARQLMAHNFDKGAGFDPDLVIPEEKPLIERLGDIVPPVLLLDSELDHSDVKRRNRFFLGTIPSATHASIERAGHNIHLENPQGFLREVRPFLAQVAR